MFGYIVVNRAELSDADYARYRAYYCGLCRERCPMQAIKKRGEER